jgi:hypothetical protein
MAQHNSHPPKLDSEFEQAIDVSLLAVPDLSDEETILTMRQFEASFASRLRDYYEPLIPDSKCILNSFLFVIEKLTT